MHYIFLDAGGAFLIASALLLILFMVLCIFVEAFIIWKMGYKAFYKENIWPSFLANTVSLLAGIIIFSATKHLHLKAWLWFIFFLISMIFEMGILRLIKRNIAAKKLLIMVVVSNLASYLMLLIIMFISII